LVNSLRNDLELDGYITFYTTEEACSPPADMPKRSWRESRARCIGGQLQNIVRAEKSCKDPVRYGIASFRWFEAPSFLFGDPEEDPDNGHAD
jgi:hypothetical protein